MMKSFGTVVVSLRLQRHRLVVDRDQLRPHERLDAAALEVGVDLFLVQRAAAPELRAAVGDADLGVGVVGELDRRLERRIAATDDQHLLPRVLARVDQAIGDLFQIFARHAQLARRAAPADRQHDPLGGEEPLVGGDGERVFLARQAGQLGLLVDLEVGLLDHALERLDQVLLADQRLTELAVERQVDGLGHDQLLPRVVRDRAADRVLLHQHVREAGGLAADRGRDARRPGADDRHVERAGDRGRVDGLLEAGRHLQPLAQRVLDQAHPRELADDVHAGAAGLEVLVDLGQIDAALLGAEHQPDGVDRALDRALAVADALGRVEQRRDAVDQPEDLPLRARGDTRSASDADIGIDDRVQRRRDIQLESDRVGQLVLGAVILHAAAQQVHCEHHDREDEPGPEELAIRSGERLQHLGTSGT